MKFPRYNRMPTAPADPTKMGEHPKNCPVCRGKMLIPYADRRHGIIMLPCPAYGGKIHPVEPKD